MPGKTEISWATDTWNLAWGCDKVSPGCANCYIPDTPPFRQRGLQFDNAGHIPIMLHRDRMDIPMRWTRPRMIFVNSLSDFWHEDIPVDFMAEAFAVMAICQHHIFQVLTKRPERMYAMLTDVAFWARVAHYMSKKAGWSVAVNNEPIWLKNVWLGVTIENRAWVKRADMLRETPAGIRFISAEPLVGPLVAIGGEEDTVEYSYDYPDPRDCVFRATWPDGKSTDDVPELVLENIDWIIIGGESGKKARSFREQWARDIIHDARAAGTAVHVKQMGSVWARQHGVSGKADLPDEWPEDLRIREWPAALAQPSENRTESLF